MNFKKDTLFFLLSLTIISALIYFLPSYFPAKLVCLPIGFYLYGLITGSIFIQKNYYITSINSLPDFEERSGIKKDTSAICLSFDDGIHAIHTPLILDILKQHHIQAMFFIIGKHIAGNEAIVQRIYSEGHTIGNHSETHSFWFDIKSTRAVAAEIKTMNQRIEAILGEAERPIYFRPPYGVTNPNVAKAITQSGMISVGWNVRSLDTKAKTQEKLLTRLKQKTKQGAIILLHDRCKISVDILTDYILFCKAQGFTFTTF